MKYSLEWQSNDNISNCSFILELIVALDTLEDSLQALQVHSGHQVDGGHNGGILKSFLIEGRGSDDFLQLGQHGDSLK